jgi:ATP-dependent Lon protease
MVQRLRDSFPVGMESTRLIEELGRFGRLDAHEMKPLFVAERSTRNARGESRAYSTYSVKSGSQAIFEEGHRGVSYYSLFGECFEGATQIDIQDPYIMSIHQIRNLGELLEMISRVKPKDKDVVLNLLTKCPKWDDQCQEQQRNLSRVRENGRLFGIYFNWKFASHSMHDRHIKTDTGWKILLGRGLDVFQPFNPGDAREPKTRLQQLREVKAFEITYLKTEPTLWC